MSYTFENESIQCPYCRSRLDITEIAHIYAGRKDVTFECKECKKKIISNFEKDGCPWDTRKAEN